jgi:hypothetical protein
MVPGIVAYYDLGVLEPDLVAISVEKVVFEGFGFRFLVRIFSYDSHDLIHH